MDAEISWIVSGEVNSLIETIINCRKELIKQCFTKFGSAKIQECKISAPQKICDFLLLSEGHKIINDKSRNTCCHKIVADFEQFSLYKTKIFGDTTIRLTAKFDVNEGVEKYWYGTISLI